MGKKISELTQLTNSAMENQNALLPVVVTNNDNSKSNKSIEFKKFRGMYPMKRTKEEGLEVTTDECDYDYGVGQPSSIIDWREEEDALVITIYSNSFEELTILYSGGNPPIIDYDEEYTSYQIIGEEPAEYDDEKYYIVSIQMGIAIYSELTDVSIASTLSLDEEE